MDRIPKPGYSISTSFFVLIFITAQTQVVYAGSKSPYQSGYDHGCDDADISDPNDRYINQPEKGPSFHTDEFMRGYNAGYDACSSEKERSDESQSTSRNDDMGSVYKFTVIVS